jgi:hypothetical protein
VLIRAYAAAAMAAGVGAAAAPASGAATKIDDSAMAAAEKAAQRRDTVRTAHLRLPQSEPARRRIEVAAPGRRTGTTEGCRALVDGGRKKGNVVVRVPRLPCDDDGPGVTA